MINISQATLDVIKAIRENKTVHFTYGSADDFERVLKPTEFFGDFDGFEGNDELIDEHRKFYFHRVNEWHGVQEPWEITITLDCYSHPTEEEVLDYMSEVVTDMRPLLYSVKQKEE
jgi:hypothetical protein|tara:strand:+ start:1042 stop:1389 length:348 start_codon:yes stop_codon:yes gene_type:complete